MKKKELTLEEKELVYNRVSKALDCQFEMYSWSDMLNDCDLTSKQSKWAKEHLRIDLFVR